MSHFLRLSKEDFKFSVAHFAIFGPHYAERLHGHNYYVAFEVTTKKPHPKLGFSVEFNELKPLLRKVCKDLDEYILIPKLSPYLKIESQQQQLEVTFSKSHYSFPKKDVLLLPVVNISCEDLSSYLWKKVKEDLSAEHLKAIQKLGVEVQEVKGQKVLFEKSLES